MVAMELLTTDQDKPPKPQPGSVRTNVQSGLITANFAKVLAEFSIKDKSEESRQWCLVGKDIICTSPSVRR